MAQLEAEWGSLGTPASPSALENLATGSPFTISAEHRAYLLRVGGLSLHEWRQARFADPETARRASHHAGGKSFVFEVDMLFGIGELEELAAAPRSVPADYYPLLTPVGKSGGGDLLCQVTLGSRPGMLVMVDHEVDELFELRASKLVPRLEDEPDGVIARLEKEGVVASHELASSLVGTLGELIRLHEQGANQPAASESEPEWTKPWSPEVEAIRQKERRVALDAYRAAKKEARGKPNERELIANAKERRNRLSAEAQARAEATVGPQKT